MNKAKKAKIIATRLILVAISIGVGILISAQWRSIPERITNPIVPYTSLNETKNSLYQENDQLKKEITNLQQGIDKAQKEAEDVTLTKNELANLQTEKAKAGLTKLNGVGVIIIYDDSKSVVLSEESIVHAADLRDTINLLWGSGAEAISINSQRIVINTAIDCIVNTILINGTRISNPFRIEVIGDQNMLYGRLIDKKYLSNIHDRQLNQGLIFEVLKNNDITLPSYNGSFEFQSGGS
jgi:uncharacterized protein YlxW (UPF0749 family)